MAVEHAASVAPEQVVHHVGRCGLVHVDHVSPYPSAVFTGAWEPLGHEANRPSA
jgi:hypothetical protein